MVQIFGSGGKVELHQFPNISLGSILEVCHEKADGILSVYVIGEVLPDHSRPN
jgi:hypothetical protein